MNRTLLQLAACLALLVQGAVVLLGGPGSQGCLRCFTELASTLTANTESDEDSCCCCCSDDGECGCCTPKHHDSRPADPEQRRDCPSMIAIPAMAADTLRPSFTADVDAALLPVSAPSPLILVAADQSDRAPTGLPPPDPGPALLAPGLAITIMLI